MAILSALCSACCSNHGRSNRLSLHPVLTSWRYAPCILRRVVGRTSWLGRAWNPLVHMRFFTTGVISKSPQCGIPTEQCSTCQHVRRVRAHPSEGVRTRACTGELELRWWAHYIAGRVKRSQPGSTDKQIHVRDRGCRLLLPCSPVS